MKNIVLSSILAVCVTISLDAESLVIVVGDDNVTIWDRDINANCASKFLTTATVSGTPLAFTILITECDTVGPITNCPCTLDVSVALSGLKSGFYTVLLYRQYQKKYLYPTDTTILVDSVSFRLNGTMGSQAAPAFKQSACKSPETHANAYTAQYWNSRASSVAQSLCEDATLLTVASESVSAEGTSAQWNYRFSRYNRWNSRVEYLYCHSDDLGVLFDSISAYTVLGIQVISASWVDSDSAIAYAESHGGKSFRENHPDCIVSTSLSEALVPDSYPCWEVVYRSTHDNAATVSIRFDARTTQDSLVDIFPLALGNVWVYNYDYEYRDVGAIINEYSDTGTVTLQVIHKTDAVDSVLWSVRETSSRWSNTNSGGWGGPAMQTDTFQIVELNYGRHMLYRADSLTSAVRSSVLPFLWNLTDTAKVYRYAAVDSADMNHVYSREHQAATLFHFGFKREVGLSFVSMSDGCTCRPYFWTSHSLRSFVVTEVARPRQASPGSNFHLSQNYPNPFNPSTTIEFSLDRTERVLLKVWNALGQEVATLVDRHLGPGNHAVHFEARDLPSGVYFYRIHAGTEYRARKFVILK